MGGGAPPSHQDTLGIAIINTRAAKRFRTTCFITTHSLLSNLCSPGVLPRRPSAGLRCSKTSGRDMALDRRERIDQPIFTSSGTRLPGIESLQTILAPAGFSKRRNTGKGTVCHLTPNLKSWRLRRRGFDTAPSGLGTLPSRYAGLIFWSGVGKPAIFLALTGGNTMMRSRAATISRTAVRPLRIRPL